VLTQVLCWGPKKARLPELVCASTVSVIGAALEAHVRQARELGWAHPLQLPRTDPGDPCQPRPALEARAPCCLSPPRFLDFGHRQGEKAVSGRAWNLWEWILGSKGS
jgi:hypothetical protein